MGEGIEESCFSNSFRQVLFILANSSSPLVLVTSCTFPSQLRTLWYKLVCAQISSWLAWNSAFLSLLSHLPLIYLLSSFQNFVAFVFSPVLLILVVLCLFVLFFFFLFLMVLLNFGSRWIRCVFSPSAWPRQSPLFFNLLWSGFCFYGTNKSDCI